MSEQFKPNNDEFNHDSENRSETNVNNHPEAPTGNALEVQDDTNEYGNALNDTGDYGNPLDNTTDNNALDDEFTDIEPHEPAGFRGDQLQTNRDEETAAEVTPVIRRPSSTPEIEGENVPEMEQQEIGGSALGWTALILSVLALFFFPVLLGSAGAITGFFAYRNGARSLGMWSIALGALAVLMGLFFIPYYVNTL